MNRTLGTFPLDFVVTHEHEHKGLVRSDFSQSDDFAYNSQTINNGEVVTEPSHRSQRERRFNSRLEGYSKGKFFNLIFVVCLIVSAV